jgi:rhodanese-related sulfurtransferase
MIRRRTLVTLAGLTLAFSPVVGCGGESSSSSEQPAAAADSSTADAPAKDTRMIIDVRTPAEFSGGHLDGAVNIDIQSPDFTSQIEALDRNGSYVVYCRSGNRSGMAMAQMLDMGFTDVSNAGSVEEASASLGIAIVG